MQSYMAIDQYGQTFHGLERPRRDLLKRLGRKHAQRMYIDQKSGPDDKGFSKSVHCGYVIAGHWLTVYEVKMLASAT